jgi:hypothetical protein
LNDIKDEKAVKKEKPSATQSVNSSTAGFQ